MPMDIFAFNGWREVNDVHLDQMSNDSKSPAVIMWDSCDIKPLSLLKIFARKPKY